MKKPKDFFQVGDRVVNTKSICGIKPRHVFDVVEHEVGPAGGQWICEIQNKIKLSGLREQSDCFEIATSDDKIEEVVTKTLSSWLKESYYTHYIEIVTDFIKGYANDHHISVVESEGKDTVLTATPIKKGN